MGGKRVRAWFGGRVRVRVEDTTGDRVRAGVRAYVRAVVGVRAGVS